MKALILLLMFSSLLWAQSIIEITVRGISDQQNDGAQQDRLEAILDAKRQACEKAGLIIESRTTVKFSGCLRSGGDSSSYRTASRISTGGDWVCAGWHLSGSAEREN